MPFTFVVCGLILLYLIFYQYHSHSAKIAMVAIISVMLSYIVAPIQLSSSTAINVLGLAGMLLALVALLLQTPAKWNTFMVIVTISVAVYIVLYRINSSYYSIFNFIPLFSLISILCIMLCKTIHGAQVAVLGSYIAIDIVNMMISSIEQLYYTLYSTETLGVVLLSLLTVTMTKAMLLSVRGRLYAKK